jgi:capsular polysaccharide biosynthesis protein/predicted O-methyltransferase YrrM
MFPRLKPCTECWGEVELRNSLPAIEAHNDVTYVPYAAGDAWGIFSQDGRAVEATVDLHGPDGTAQNQILQWHGVVPPDADDQLYVYAGAINLHYGHFLINTLSRLWPMAVEVPAGRLLFHGPGEPAEWFAVPFIGEIFAALGVTPDRIAVFDAPVQIKTLYVPRTSFQEQRFVHRIYADLTHQIGANLLRGRAPRPGLPPVYLSKTSLDAGVGRVLNEAEIESRLSERGVEIVRPETLPLVEQIALFIERPAVLGTTGSGFHTSIFVASRAKLLVLSTIPGPNSNFLLIDAANSNDADYVYCGDTEVVELPDDPFLTSFYIPDPVNVADELIARLGAELTGNRLVGHNAVSSRPAHYALPLDSTADQSELDQQRPTGSDRMSNDDFFETFFPSTFWPAIRERNFPVDDHSMFGDEDTFKVLVERFRPSTIIEVGSWKGHSANFIADQCKLAGIPARILCIDTFLGSVEHWHLPEARVQLFRESGRPTILERFLGNTIASGNDGIVFPLTLDSNNAAQLLAQWEFRADMIFIDAAHDPVGVTADLTAFYPLLAEGGVMFGDDYQYEPLANAVHEFASLHQLHVLVSARKWAFASPGNFEAFFGQPFELRSSRAGWIHP